MKAYAGIGSRETPTDVLALMRNVAYDLATKGWTLRSGCAPGADSAFEEGAFDAYFVHRIIPKPELYLPWPKFEGRRRAIVTLERPDPEAYPIAEKFHPAWDRLSDGAKALHARNVHQVLGPAFPVGKDMSAFSPSRFVLCWTRGAAGGGGTGQAIRIAREYGVPIFDLADPQTRERVEGMWA